MDPLPGFPVREVARTSRSARATFAMGERLGAALLPGDVVALVGELGAGKTQLARGICHGAGVPDGEVASPTFAIVATYHGRVPLHHADLYRVGGEDELHATGFFDLVGGEGALLVEWADLVPGALPSEQLEIRLAHDPVRPGTRHLQVRGTGARHAELAGLLGKGVSARPAPESQGERASERPAPARGRRRQE